jgi:hypothetical protein
MASWLVKAGVQGAISLLPWRDRLNSAFQQHLTDTAALSDRRLARKLTHARRHLRHYARATGRREPPRVALELGTGWYPIVPIGLALCGVERVVSFDIQPLATPERTRELLERCIHSRDRGELARLLPRMSPAAARRLDDCLRQEPGDGSTLLAPLGVELHVAPTPAAAVPPGSVDLLVSSNTLEHIAPDRLGQVIGDLARLAAPGAVMDHFIDMRDHYATFDRRLSRLNYLRYSDAMWAVLNNRLQYQNRLRLPDYREIIERAGFTIVAERRIEGRDGEFDELRLARRFRRMARDEALVLYAWLTAMPARAHRE